MKLLVGNNVAQADLRRWVKRRRGSLAAATFACIDCDRRHESFEQAARCHPTGWA